MLNSVVNKARHHHRGTETQSYTEKLPSCSDCSWFKLLSFLLEKQEVGELLHNFFIEMMSPCGDKMGGPARHFFSSKSPLATSKFLLTGKKSNMV
jgi:hypothetical protein